jgi:hypothetical protein
MVALLDARRVWEDSGSKVSIESPEEVARVNTTTSSLRFSLNTPST